MNDHQVGSSRPYRCDRSLVRFNDSSRIALAPIAQVRIAEFQHGGVPLAIDLTREKLTERIALRLRLTVSANSGVDDTGQIIFNTRGSLDDSQANTFRRGELFKSLEDVIAH